MNNTDFIVFIISHGRADKMKTVSSLKKANYSGRWVVVIDDLDKTKEAYFKNFGKENVYIFDKMKYALSTDNGDNFENYRSTTHARNACFDIAEELGYTYFLVLDDDYTDFRYKFNSQYQYSDKVMNVKNNTGNIDRIFDYVLDYYKSASQITSIAFAQGGDFMGGKNGDNAKMPGLKRKCMNSFFCSTERKFQFFSRLNEDVNTYITLGSRGVLFLTMTNFALNQVQSQATKGGMTEAYLDGGTYIKSFYSVMYCPSFMQVSTLNSNFTRIHHVTYWENAVPKIIDEKNRRI